MNSVSTDKLLPCPFCGEQPKVLFSTGEIVCGGQDCFGPVTTAGNIEDATVQWNKRAAFTPADVNAEMLGARESVVLAIAFLNRDAGTDRMATTLPQVVAELAKADALLSRASAPAGAGWQPIETAPKDGTWIFGYENRIGMNDKYAAHEVMRWSKRALLWRSSADKICEPTHWMPLPAPPARIAEESNKDMNTIYLVQGNCGEYSDYREWVICGYPTEEMAREHARLAKEWRQQHITHDMSWEDREKLTNPFDEDGYYGTNIDTDWTAYGVEIRSALPSQHDGQAADKTGT